MNDIKTHSESLPILFFDGACVLCNGFADFILKHDKGGKLRLASIQGTTAATLLSDELRTDMQSVILISNGKTYTRSKAVIRILMHMGGVYASASVLLLIPSALSDAVYRLVSRKRYAWFGKRAHCRLPDVSEADRFLP
jgi:predicted DCC family thiol-disulfide oxidoreductase YuxK